MSARNNCAGDGANDGGGRWSEFLLPAVGGVGSEGEQMVEEGIYDKSYCSTSTFQSYTPFKSLPSYMKSKSGVEMDPDRVGGPTTISTPLATFSSAPSCNL